ncbi:MAG: hypothetical protein IPL79_16210 [Myxococcales bacterium]|nr:hypothetical protein [Myxococcales bacterium]
MRRKHALIILILASALSMTACVGLDNEDPQFEQTEEAQTDTGNGGWFWRRGDSHTIPAHCESITENGEICNFACAGLSEAECRRTGDCVWQQETTNDG